MTRNDLEDLRDLTLAIARISTDEPEMVSFDDALAAFGLTKDDLGAADDLQTADRLLENCRSSSSVLPICG